MDPRKIEAITKWPQPKTVTDVRSFTGFTIYEDLSRVMLKLCIHCMSSPQETMQSKKLKE